MKNIHILPTDQETYRIFKNRHLGDRLFHWNMNLANPMNQLNYIGQNIYITSEEMPKEGEWAIYDKKYIRKIDATFNKQGMDWNALNTSKIIMSTDDDLIADIRTSRVQEIDDNFIEWIVKNPRCEFVEVKRNPIVCGIVPGVGVKRFRTGYKIIIPKEEPKQENNFYGQLKHYFETTPQEKILEDWAKSAEYDKIGPTFEEFVQNNKNVLSEKCDESCYYHCTQGGTQMPDCVNETIEQAAEKYAHNYFDMHEKNNYKALKQGFEAGARWGKEKYNSTLKEAITLLKTTTEYEVIDDFKEKVSILERDTRNNEISAYE